MKGFFNKNKWRFLTAVLVVLLIIAFIPTPYYLYQPGSAEPLSPIVTVENGKKDEKGKLFLTTVLSTRASNLYILASGFVTPHTQIQKKEDVQGDYTDEEYSRLLTHMMSSSQQNAIAAGLKEAGEKVEIIRKGVFVQSVMKDSNAKKILQLGDVVTAADGHKLLSPIELVTYLKENKKAGDTVQITYQHEGKTKTAPIKLIQLDKTRAGLGIGFDDEFTLKTPKKVDIDAKDIGGPSAGLMFSLEILNQVVPEDLTKGYKIAGTGTIDVNGNVGQIGGIEDKIVAAHNEGAEIFLSPADTLKGDSNTKEVIKAAKEDGYDIKIVPVKDIKEAADFLRKLPPKK